MKKLVIAIVALLLASAPASGVDGVLEINQTCAVNTGCFDGDGASFPVTITGTGVSVRLTSNLTVPDETTTAIQVVGNNVSVDLNGFAILGPTVCSGSPLTCTPLGTGVGVRSLVESTAVSNGTVKGVGSIGIRLGPDSRVTGVRARGNGSTGIFVTVTSVVTDCVATGNGDQGIFGDNSVIRDNVASGNRTYGIDSFGSTVIGNTMLLNGSFGLHAGAATGYGNNQISVNNGGNTNPQVQGLSFQIAPNVCGGDLTCP